MSTPSTDELWAGERPHYLRERKKYVRGCARLGGHVSVLSDYCRRLRRRSRKKQR